jgi:hypothetical protein
MKHVLLALLAAVFLSACANAAPRSADIELPAAFHDGMVYLKVSVNGAEPVWMNLDNGTSPSAIRLDYAQNLGLRLKKAAGWGTGIGHKPVEFFNTKADLTAGGDTRHIDFSASRLDGMMGPDGQPLAGVLGHSFLAGRILVIDYPRSRAWFASRVKPCGCDLAMGEDFNIPTVPVTIAGHRMTALIDSGGMYELLITPAGVRTAGLQAHAETGKPRTSYGYAGAQNVRVGAAPDVVVGSIRRNNPSTVYAAFGTSPLKSQAALGALFLKNYRVTLNYRARKVRLE